MGQGHHQGHGSHHHHHHGEAVGAGSQTRIYRIAIILNLAFVGIETLIGFIGNSIGLIADAGHNLSDVFSLLLTLVAVRLSMTHGTKRFTYGFRKSSILISLLNAIILLVAVGGIAVESIRRIAETSMDCIGSFNNGSLISWAAGAGIVVNGITAWMLSKGNKDINQRGAYLHMLADTMVSAGVVVSGIVISYTGLEIIDPVVSLSITAIILWSTWGLLTESLRMSIDAVPDGVSPDEVIREIRRVSGVADIHHLHIWSISTNEVALTAHVVIDDKDRLEGIVKEVKRISREKGIHHSTIEVETERSECEEKEC